MRCHSVRSIGLSLFLVTGMFALAAGDRKPPRKSGPALKSVDRIDPTRPWQHGDGRVQHHGRMFDSWESWREANPDHDHRCGTRSPATPPGGDGVAGVSDCSLTSTIPGDAYDPANGNLVIPVVVHVIMNDDGTLGDLDRETIERQMVILNDDFSGVGVNSDPGMPSASIRFVLASTDPAGEPTNGITRSNDSTWFNDQGSYWDSLAWDPNRYLNVYTNSGGGVLGYVNAFPAEGLAGEIYDRVVVDWRAFGEGGNYGPPQDLGRILTHEVGHYLGLFHTFEGGCSSSLCFETGDLICDTPSQSDPTFACSDSGSCGEADPVSNFMNYSWQFCMKGFTEEQIRRMRCTLETYRPALGIRSEACEYACAGDLNGDGTVDGQDLGKMLALIGGPPSEVIQCGDFDLDGMITGSDLGQILVSWGVCEVPACATVFGCDDGDECTVDYCADGDCVHLSEQFCGICGVPEAGSCYESNGSPGCSEQDCCDAICNVDPFCCIINWDAACRNKANSGDYPECDG